MKRARLVMKVNSLLAACLFLPIIGGQVLAQPEPWVHPDGSIHYYSAVAVPTGIDWATASDSAGRRGGYLATLTSQAENDFVFRLVSSRPYWYQRPGSYSWAGPWLGGRQRAGSLEPDSGWEWVSGEPFSFDDWSPGQPNNFHGNQDALNYGESWCGWLSTWNDQSEADTSIRGFVVELSAESTTIGLLQNDTSAFLGYTLFEANRSHFIFLIDNKGRYIHSWYSPYLPALSNYLLEDGSLLHTGNVGNSHFSGGGIGGRVSRIDWDGNLVWFYEYSNDDHCQHHDIEPLPNGNILLVAWERKTRAQAIAAGRDSSKIWNEEVWPDHVIEVKPENNKIVWEWHAWDHLIQDFDSTRANYGVVAEHPELVDINYVRSGFRSANWMHTNAVDYNAQFDQVLINVRDLGEIWVIDHSTSTAEAQGHSGGRYGMGGDILYRWGNPQVYRAGDSADQKFYAQHDARWIEPGLPGAGHIMVFNNGVGRPGGNYSTVDEIVPACDSTGSYPRPAPGTPFGPTTQCWTYVAAPPTSFYSELKSGAHRLPNGNTIICEAGRGLFFEVTPGSQVVWRYLNPTIDSACLYQGDTIPNAAWGKQNCTFRATRYAPDYPAFVGRDLGARYPLERYSPPNAGISEPTKPSGPARSVLTVFPSPARAGKSIRLRSALSTAQVSVFDATGRQVGSLAMRQSSSSSGCSCCWNTRDAAGRLCPPGVYVCRLTAPGTSATAKLIITE